MSKGYMDEKQEWANTGNIVSPSGSKINLGWVAGEQPPHEWENHQQNEQDIRINKLIRRDGQACTKPGSRQANDIFDKLFYSNKGWHNSVEVNNLLNYGSVIEDSVVVWDYENDCPMLIFIDPTALAGNNLKKISGWNYEDNLSTQVENLPISPAITIIVSGSKKCCADKDYLYVLTNDNTGGIGNYFILKFALNPWTGSPVTEYDTGIGATGAPIVEDFIVADPNNLAFSVAGITNVINVVPKTLISIASGDGNKTAGYRINRVSSIVSDGVSIFFISEDYSGSGNFYLAAADISNPATSTVPAAEILLSSIDFVGALLNIGDETIIYGISATSRVLGRYSRDINSLDWFHMLQNSRAIDTAGHFCFDGKHIYILFCIHEDYCEDGGTDYTYGVIKIPAYEFSQFLDLGGLTARNVEKIPYPLFKVASEYDFDYAVMNYDGNDIWVTIDDTGDVFRICSCAHIE